MIALINRHMLKEGISMKKFFSVVLLLTMMGLCACSNNNDGSNSKNDEAIIIKDTTVEKSTIIESLDSNESQKKDDQEKAEQLQQIAKDRTNAYMKALMNLAFNGESPECADIKYDNSKGSISDNQFAIVDIDMDGDDELIIKYVTADEEDKKEYVFRYNAMSGMLDMEFSEYPTIRYYDNGYVMVDTAHLERVDDDYKWMYNLYRNDEYGNYMTVVSVNAWFKDVTPVNCAGEDFPDEIDIDKAGVVYCMYTDNESKQICQSEYDKWFADVMKDASVIEVPYLNMSEENIWALDKDREVKRG